VLIVLSLAAGIVIAGSPIVFEENRGQASREVLFLSRGAGYGVFLTRNRTLIASNDAKVVQIGLVSAKEVKPEGVDRLSAKSNYFIGSEPAQWHTGIFNCARVRYADVYPGIDVLWHGRDGQIEHDFTVGPGGDPRKIRFFFHPRREPGTQLRGRAHRRQGKTPQAPRLSGWPGGRMPL